MSVMETNIDFLERIMNFQNDKESVENLIKMNDELKNKIVEMFTTINLKNLNLYLRDKSYVEFSKTVILMNKSKIRYSPNDYYELLSYYNIVEQHIINNLNKIRTLDTKMQNEILMLINAIDNKHTKKIRNNIIKTFASNELSLCFPVTEIPVTGKIDDIYVRYNIFIKYINDNMNLYNVTFPKDWFMIPELYIEFCCKEFAIIQKLLTPTIDAKLIISTLKIVNNIENKLTEMAKNVYNAPIYKYNGVISKCFDQHMNIYVNHIASEMGIMMENLKKEIIDNKVNASDISVIICRFISVEKEYIKNINKNDILESVWIVVYECLRKFCEWLCDKNKLNTSLVYCDIMNLCCHNVVAVCCDMIEFVDKNIIETHDITKLFTNNCEICYQPWMNDTIKILIKHLKNCFEKGMTDVKKIILDKIADVKKIVDLDTFKKILYKFSQIYTYIYKMELYNIISSYEIDYCKCLTDCSEIYTMFKELGLCSTGLKELKYIQSLINIMMCDVTNTFVDDNYILRVPVDYQSIYDCDKILRLKKITNRELRTKSNERLIQLNVPQYDKNYTVYQNIYDMYYGNKRFINQLNKNFFS